MNDCLDEHFRFFGQYTIVNPRKAVIIFFQEEAVQCVVISEIYQVNIDIAGYKPLLVSGNIC